MWILILSSSLAAERRTPVVIAVEIATPSVVALEVELPVQSPFFMRGAQSQQAQGSGVIITDDGIVLTNAHVIEGATRILAHTADGRVFEAFPIAVETHLDLAVLRLENATGLVGIKVADSDDLMLGETAIAIGNPYGLGLTITTGVVASRGRQVEIQPGVTQTYIQTDAAINPGNSGGALVNLDGQLIGINTAIKAQAEGIGFAIPANRAKKIAEDLLNYGSVRAPWLGCDFAEVNPRRLVGTPLSGGALRVLAVHPKSPCSKTALEVGDLAFHIDGRAMASRADLNTWLASKKPGDDVKILVLRDGEVHSHILATTDLPKTAARQSLDRLGITVTPLQGGALKVQAAKLGGTWVQARLRTGDLLLAVDGEPVRTLDELLDRLAAGKARHEPSALFTVQRGRIRGHVEVGI